MLHPRGNPLEHDADFVIRRGWERPEIERVPSSGAWKTPSKSSVWKVVAAELAEGPLFISWPVDIEPSDFREGMTLELWWTDAADRFSDYNLPVFGPPSARG